MNILRIRLYVLVVIMTMCVGNVAAKGSMFDSVSGKLDDIFTGDMKSIATGALGMAGGGILLEQLHKKNPVAVAAVAAGLGSATGGSPKAGLAAGATSCICSTADYFIPKKVKETVKDTLPECLTSEGTKMAIQILVATMVGYYFGKEVEGT